MHLPDFDIYTLFAEVAINMGEVLNRVIRQIIYMMQGGTPKTNHIHAERILAIH